MALSPTAIVAKGNTLTISSEGESRAMNGAEKAAVMMLALGDRYGGPIWKLLDEIEIKQLSVAMSKLGPITPNMLDDLMIEFVTRVSSSGSLMGNYDTTERLLL